jgi:hypothetical protein
MLLTTHAAVGVTAAALFPHQPALGFAAAFVSHFVLDAIPHSDYRILSIRRNSQDPLDEDMVFGRAFFLDMLRIGSDCCIGIIIAVSLGVGAYGLSITAALIGAIGGIAPDALQFVYWKLRIEPLTSLQRLHVAIQRWHTHSIRPLIGFPIQALIVLTLAGITVLAT